MFRKLPQDVEMMCWNGENLGAIAAWVDGILGQMAATAHDFEVIEDFVSVGKPKLSFWCTKSLATVTIAAGDWIALESDRTGFYPLAADVKEASYEPEPVEP